MEVQQQISCGSLEAPLAGKLAGVVVFNSKLSLFRRDGFCASKVWRPVGRQCIIVKLVRLSTTLSMSHNFILIITTIFAGIIAFSMQGQFSRGHSKLQPVQYYYLELHWWWRLPRHRRRYPVHNCEQADSGHPLHSICKESHQNGVRSPTATRRWWHGWTCNQLAR